jgi:hypothetical protein
MTLPDPDELTLLQARILSLLDCLDQKLQGLDAKVERLARQMEGMVARCESGRRQSEASFEAFRARLEALQEDPEVVRKRRLARERHGAEMDRCMRALSNFVVRTEQIHDRAYAGMRQQRGMRYEAATDWAADQPLMRLPRHRSPMAQ